MTTDKPHLPARVPNEGARRLAWWMLTREGGTAWTASTVGVSEATLSRIIAGEVAPSEALAERIALVSEQEIIPGDWDAQPEGGWWDMPARGLVIRTPEGLRRYPHQARAA
jgi:hypothetical protein